MIGLVFVVLEEVVKVVEKENIDGDGVKDLLLVYDGNLVGNNGKSSLLLATLSSFISFEGRPV